MSKRKRGNRSHHDPSTAAADAKGPAIRHLAVASDAKHDGTLFIDPATGKPIRDPVYFSHPGMQPIFYDRSTVMAMVDAEDKKLKQGTKLKLPLHSLGITKANIGNHLVPAMLAKGVIDLSLPKGH